MNKLVQRLAGAAARGITQSKKKISLLAKSFHCNIYSEHKQKIKSLEHIKVSTFSFFDIQYDGESSYKC